MIDVHTHVLPCFDDGAESIETAISMLEMEKEQGVDCVVFTPHYYGRKDSPSQFLAKRREAYDAIKDKIPDGLRVLLGAEVHFTGVNVPEHEELCSLSIEGTKYILVEFPFTTEWTRSLIDKLADFINDTGYTPIIAHAERYIEVLQNPALITQFVEMGCLIQVNASSFCQRFTKNLAYALLKHGLVHCIGTDAHDMENRSPEYVKAKQTVEKAGYSAEWKRAQEIMSRVVRGEQVCVEYGKPIKRFFGKYL